ncbi:MAG: glycosyltransferase family 2 protein [Actinomycetota bacterium]|nr:glycosyltransferase family 2 protein [Actinomycetota bacterium]
MEYVLPIKTKPGDDLTDLAQYVATLTGYLSVIVVDGSDAPIFQRNAALFSHAVHVAPNPSLHCVNGKVAGVRTGFELCASEKVVVADDDVRYQWCELERLAQLLDNADIVSPQNYYAPLPWHALWDTARMLLNRLTPSGDFPGTLAIRLTPALREAGYDGDVLFENLELIRTVVAAGGRALAARDLYVRRLPPSRTHFLGQRVRQAYDSQAQPGRLLLELLLLPTGLVAFRHRGVLASLGAASVVAAEIGRRRAGGATYFPAAACALAPLWLLERAVCAWIAMGQRTFCHGTSYSGQRIKRAATPLSKLRHACPRSDDCRHSTALPASAHNDKGRRSGKTTRRPQ